MASTKLGKLVSAFVATLGLASVHAAFAQWTPSADAPAGVLTPLERDRHDRFIVRAQAGDLDLVFFGTTPTEMWHWANRGRRVWDRELGSLKAANFGSQGTRFESLLWRMRNGELDGYEAMLIVLQLGPGDNRISDPFAPRSRTEFIAGYTPIVAELRARQPQAKILLLAGFPRGQVRRDEWQETAAANAAVYAELADGETVFYTDIGHRFFLPDGSFDHELWALGGIRPSAFEVWAEELRPWLDRFVH